MQFDDRNMMVGGAPHIRVVGPHNHAWQAAGSDSTALYDECAVCGARRCNMAVNEWHLAARADWLLGGPWDVPATAEEPPAAAPDPEPPAASAKPKGKAAVAGEP